MAFFQLPLKNKALSPSLSHDLKRLIERGVDPIVRGKELLSHSSVKITERYTHSNQEEKKREVELLCENAHRTTKKAENLVCTCDMEKKRACVHILSVFS